MPKTRLCRRASSHLTAIFIISRIVTYVTPTLQIDVGCTIEITLTRHQHVITFNDFNFLIILVVLEHQPV